MNQPLLPTDLSRIAVAAEPQLAPDGRTVVFRRTAFDAEDDTTGGALWRVRADGSSGPFTTGKNDRLPRISPDGSRVAFVRDSGETSRLHVIGLDGGEAQPLGDACERVSSLAWSPDGGRLAYTAAAPFERQTAHVYLDEKSGTRHIRALPYKGDLEGLHDGRRSHLFVLVLDGAPARALTAGDFDVEGAVWSPDGRTIAVSIDGEAEASPVADIAIVDVDTGALRRLTASDGPAAGPAFSPDGRRIAWIGHRHKNDTRFAAELFVANADGSAARSLSAALDRPVVDSVGGDLRSGGPAAPQWCNAREIMVVVSDAGNASLRAFDADSGAVRVVAGGEREIYAFSVGPGEAVAFAFSTPLVPSEIARSAGGSERVVTDLNAWLRDKAVVAPCRLAASAPDGTPLDAWLIVPPGERATPPPLVLEIHGGPHSSYGNTFFLEFQILAGCGFAVAYGNPRGSAGYGQAFASAITGDWGGLDASDVLAILDAALAAEPLDATHVAAVGGSYGGFMTTWLLGHTDRFATGISMRACNDFVSFTGATDIGFFFAAELGLGLTAGGMRELFERSPIRAAEHIAAPLLIMHSERDYRCPIDQGEQLFNLLRMLGKKDVEFVRFSGDGHELSRSGQPRRRVLRLRAIAHWLRRQIGAGGAGTAGGLFDPLPGEELSASESHVTP